MPLKNGYRPIDQIELLQDAHLQRESSPKIQSSRGSGEKNCFIDLA